MKLITRGNKKLPKSTAIFNITPAAMCPSRALGMCQLDKCGVGSHRCYAANAEMRYGKGVVLPHRMRQMELWDSTAHSIVGEFSSVFRNSRIPITAVRLNESGDFRYRSDVIKLIWLAQFFPDVVWYFYTARQDLFPSHVMRNIPSNVVVSGSGWMAHNKYVVLAGTQSKAKADYMCPGDCKKCSVCLKRGGLTIGAKLH